jgi:hypothetical protein
MVTQGSLLVQRARQAVGLGRVQVLSAVGQLGSARWAVIETLSTTKPSWGFWKYEDRPFGIWAIGGTEAPVARL